MTDIPKKPIAVSRAKKKLPLEIDWGKGIPKDRLRYINAREEALIKAHRHSKAERSHEGVKAYPDPGDTAAGQKGVGGVSTGNSSTGGGDKGGKGQGGQGSGPSRSPSSSSKSPSSTSKPAKTSTQSAAAPAGGSRAPNAAAQAASNKLNSGAQASRSPLNSAGGSSSLSRAPNAAAKAAFDKLNASKNALSTSSRPQSIQGMINSGNSSPNAAAQAAFDRQKMAAMSQRYDPVVRGAPIPTKGALPGAAPGDFVRTGLAYNINKMDQMGVTDANRIVAGFDNIKQFKDVTYDSAGVQKIKDRLGYTPVGIRLNNPGNLTYASWEKAIPGFSGVVPAKKGDLKYGSFTDPRWGLVAQNELLGRYVDKGLNSINSIMDKYAPKDENNPGASNPNYKSHLSAATGWGINDPLTREQAQSLGPHMTSFENAGTMLAGGPFGGTPGSLGSIGLATAAPRPSEPPAPGPQPIPSPISQGMLGSQPQQAPQQAQLPTDPRLNLPQGNLAPPEMGSPPGYMSQFAMNEQDMDSLKQQAMKDFSFGELMQMQKNMGSLPGFMGPITRDQERVSQMASQAPQSPLPASLPGLPPGFKPPGNFRSPPVSNPDTYSPQAGPGDIETPPQVYSDNPMQGPSNPMQEGENPQVQRDRQMTYAKWGAAIGTVVAGHIGAGVGGVLGWQMGKTPPSQRRAIASNPKALNANVQSINKLVEDRGGKQPGMQVTPQGLQAVLTNPQQVASNPQQYTTLEQMLAALAMGIDPSTGKPIS